MSNGSLPQDSKTASEASEENEQYEQIEPVQVISREGVRIRSENQDRMSFYGSIFKLWSATSFETDGVSSRLSNIASRSSNV